MRQINIHEAKTQLSRLVEDAAGGEDIIIAKAGKPVARLTALESSSAPRRFGTLKGNIHVADDFDAPLPEEILAAFEGNG
jgi:prevent-host-death family protein